jgi:hypothetical protein
MQMRLILTICSFIFMIHPLKAQLGIELQVGGANFLGASVNASYTVQLGKAGVQSLNTTLGIGALYPGWTNAPNDYRITTVIYHAGLNYQYKRLGAGVEASFFAPNPFLQVYSTTGLVDLIVYPNINYLVFNRESWYFKVSGGAYFAFDKNSFSTDVLPQYDFAGDVIPGIGITAGIKLYRNK